MPHTRHHFLHNFFKNKEINSMYITMALNSFAANLVAVFVPIYLWELGYNIIQIIFFHFIWAVFWIIISPVAVKLISSKGIKHTIFYSSFFLIAYYLALNYMGQAPWLFYLAPLLSAFRSSFFWIGWHVNFVEHSDKKKQGQEVALVQSIAVITNFLTPFIGGAIIFWLNWQWAFIVASVILLFSIWPLMRTKDTKEKICFSVKEIFSWIFSRKHLRMNLSFIGYASDAVIGAMLWPIFIFIIIGSIEKVGAVISLSMIASVIVLYFVGRLTDKTSKRKIIKIATFFYAISWIGRIFANTAGFIFGIDTYRNIAGKFVEVPWTTRAYALAKKEKAFEFIVAKELVFRLSRVILLPLLMLLFWQFGFVAFLISFGIAALVSLLYMTL